MLEIMLDKAKEVMRKAYAPYSSFHVGSCIRTKSNNLYVGANVENIVFPSSQCAEASAIGAMVASGDRHIEEILVMGSGMMFCAPCGNCRQMIREHGSQATLIHICNSEKLLKTLTLNELLPYSFASNMMEYS